MSAFGIIINGIVIIMLLYYIVKIVFNIIRLNKNVGKLENKLYLITKPLRPNNNDKMQTNKTEQVQK